MRIGKLTLLSPLKFKESEYIILKVNFTSEWNFSFTGYIWANGVFYKYGLWLFVSKIFVLISFNTCFVGLKRWNLAFAFLLWWCLFLDVTYLAGLALHLVVPRCVINNTNLLTNGYLDITCPDNVTMHRLLLILIADDNKMAIMQICEIQVIGKKINVEILSKDRSYLLEHLRTPF